MKNWHNTKPVKQVNWIKNICIFWEMRSNNMGIEWKTSQIFYLSNVKKIAAKERFKGDFQEAKKTQWLMCKSLFDTPRTNTINISLSW